MKEGGRQRGRDREREREGGRQELKTGHSCIMAIQLNPSSLPKSPIPDSINIQFHVKWTPAQFQILTQQFTVIWFRILFQSLLIKAQSPHVPASNLQFFRESSFSTTDPTLHLTLATLMIKTCQQLALPGPLEKVQSSWPDIQGPLHLAQIFHFKLTFTMPHCLCSQNGSSTCRIISVL